jgi:hypothetical protein
VKSANRTYKTAAISFRARPGRNVTVKARLPTAVRTLLAIAAHHRLKATLKATTTTYQAPVNTTVTLQR